MAGEGKDAKGMTSTKQDDPISTSGGVRAHVDPSGRNEFPPDLSFLTEEQIALVACIAQIQAFHECGFGPTGETKEHGSDDGNREHFMRHACTILDRWGCPLPEDWG